MAACWILYMCTAALRTLVEVKVWRGRALVRRNTHGESASWYAMQLVKLSVPLSFNFLTFLPPQLYEDTVFYNFLGRLINLTPLGESFDLLFPTVILLPVCATLFNLYGHVQNWLGYDRIIVDEQDDIEDGILMATSSCRAGRELIHRELSAQSVPEIGGSTASRNSEDFNDSDPLRLSIPAARHSPIAGPLRTSPVARSQRPVLEPEEEEEEETFFEALAHRMKNTLDTAEPPQWLQGIKRPRWMGGDDSPAPSPSANGPDLGRWFGGRPDGRVRL